MKLDLQVCGLRDKNILPIKPEKIIVEDSNSGYDFFSSVSEDLSKETPILTDAKKWLDIYFSGEEPKFTPSLHPTGSAFRQAVWQILLQIPYGQTITYGEIARQMSEMQNTPHMSAQAVGGAVGHNEISIIIPCHRVVGTNGSLTGYAGGIDKKIALLNLEHTDMSHFFVPKKGTRSRRDEKGKNTD